MFELVKPCKILRNLKLWHLSENFLTHPRIPKQVEDMDRETAGRNWILNGAQGEHRKHRTLDFEFTKEQNAYKDYMYKNEYRKSYPIFP